MISLVKDSQRMMISGSHHCNDKINLRAIAFLVDQNVLKRNCMRAVLSFSSSLQESKPTFRCIRITRVCFAIRMPFVLRSPPLSLLIPYGSVICGIFSTNHYLILLSSFKNDRIHFFPPFQTHGMLSC